MNNILVFPSYGVLTGRAQSMSIARNKARRLGHRLTRFVPTSQSSARNMYSPDEYRSECSCCGEECFVAYKGLEWKVIFATTMMTPCEPLKS